jgi:5'-nucleotidase/2',3'-cyclic-nucleotide 2'-phosphodiesterase/3'-nucleotidase/5'-nucleotidase
VPPGSTFYAFIRCLACRGILSGYSTSPPCSPAGAPCFQPGANVTRGQAAKIIAGAAGFADPIPSSRQTFSDVPPASPFWLYIERCVLHNVLSGYSTNPPCTSGVPCFQPDNSLTRGQLAKIAANAAGLQAPVPSTQQTFEDVPNSSPFWLWIERLAGLGVISGYPCGPAPAGPCVPPGNRPYFVWTNGVTRGQTAKIVANTFFPNCLTPAR